MFCPVVGTSLGTDGGDRLGDWDRTGVADDGVDVEDVEVDGATERGAVGEPVTEGVVDAAVAGA